MWQLYQRIRYYFRLKRRLRESARVWAKLEATPGLNEEMEEGLAQIAAGETIAWSEIRERNYEPLRPNG